MRAPIAGIIAAWAISVTVLAAAIDAETRSFLASKKIFDVPAVWQVLGEARSIVSNMSILQADMYMHGGAGHFYEEHKDGLAIGGIGAREEHEHDDTCGHNGVAEKEPRRSFNPLFDISGAVTVAEHKHLTGREEAEIIPWLYFSAKIDPENVMAYTLMAYWLGDRLGKPREALDFLKEGLKADPDSWEINVETGRLYQQRLHDPHAAARYLQRAESLILTAPHDRFQERYVLSWLAEARESLGEHALAAKDYRRIEALFPETTIYRKKIERLEGLAADK